MGVTCLCEAVLWSPWQHRGDLTTETYVCMLHLGFTDIYEIIGRYPSIKSLGYRHARLFLESLADRRRNDLFNSSMCLTEQYPDTRSSNYAGMKRTASNGSDKG